MEKIFVTGSAGMVGSHLVEYYSQHLAKENIIATYYHPTIDINDVDQKAVFVQCDVRDHETLEQLIAKHKPTKVFHLAAQSYPTVSWEKPVETMNINAVGTINLFESIKKLKSYDPVVVVACSSAEYGSSLTPENTPVKESAMLLPLHPYGVSKVAQDLLAYQYFKNDNIRSIRARIFNTTGPRKTNDVTSDFVQRAYDIKSGKLSAMKVGNLETKRAIMDVRDLVNALVLLSDKGNWGDVYNISGDKVYRIDELLPIIEKVSGLKLKIEQDKSLMRPSDEPVIYGDSSKLKKDTGWKQRITIEQTIADMYDYLGQKGA